MGFIHVNEAMEIVGAAAVAVLGIIYSSGWTNFLLRLSLATASTSREASDAADLPSKHNNGENRA